MTKIGVSVCLPSVALDVEKVQNDGHIKDPVSGFPAHKEDPNEFT